MMPILRLRSPLSSFVTLMLLLVLAQLIQPLFAQQLKLAQNYSGQAFFEPWNYKTGDDVKDLNGQAGNLGNVNFLDFPTSQQLNLTSVNAAGNVVIKVDDVTKGTSDPKFGRNTMYLYSKEAYTAGTLIVLDAVHIPFGCSVWPAFWTLGLGADWPLRGEIDIIENVNLATNNQVALHTTDGCTHPGTSANQTNSVKSDNCFIEAPGQPHNQGCVMVQSELTFGAKFAENGGGVWATLWDEQGIKIWFFTRSQIPADISTPTPNPDNWGLPDAFWPQSTCDTTKFLGAQTLILETNICGHFAANVFGTCDSVASQCTDLVADPANYHNAYWEIKYLSIFTNATTTASSTSASSSTSSVSSTETKGGSNPTSSSGSVRGSSGGAIGLSVDPLWFLATAAIASVGVFIAF